MPCPRSAYRLLGTSIMQLTLYHSKYDRQHRVWQMHINRMPNPILTLGRLSCLTNWLRSKKYLGINEAKKVDGECSAQRKKYMPKGDVWWHNNFWELKHKLDWSINIKKKKKRSYTMEDEELDRSLVTKWECQPWEVWLLTWNPIDSYWSVSTEGNRDRVGSDNYIDVLPHGEKVPFWYLLFIFLQ